MKKLFFIAALVSLCASVIAQTTFTGKPRYKILTKRNNDTLGIIHVELWPTIAPKHVRNFDSLVSVSFFDSIAFHRVVPNFVIQGGDPNSRHGPVSTWGYGQPGQPTVPAEFSLAKHLRGVLSAARLANDINSATSQFFICVATAANLNGGYSAYGRVTSGMTVVDTIVLQPTVTGTQRPVQKIEMFITANGSNDSLPPKPVLTAPLDNTVDQDTSISFQLKWNKVNEAIFYHLDIARDSLFTDTVISTKLTNNFYIMNNLTGNTFYYWKVGANNGGNISKSDTWNFHTKGGETTSIPKSTINESLSVFPNPGYGLFTFSNIAVGSVIQVYDLTGRMVAEFPVTNRECVIDLQKKAKGEYFYKISNGSVFTKQGKLVLQ
jgi:peptidyl-prolyl cis-trans isomerase B (cyclophilin B)